MTKKLLKHRSDRRMEKNDKIDEHNRKLYDRITNAQPHVPNKQDLDKFNSKQAKLKKFFDN